MYHQIVSYIILIILMMLSVIGTTAAAFVLRSLWVINEKIFELTIAGHHCLTSAESDSTDQEHQKAAKNIKMLSVICAASLCGKYKRAMWLNFAMGIILILIYGGLILSIAHNIFNPIIAVVTFIVITYMLYRLFHDNKRNDIHIAGTYLIYITAVKDIISKMVKNNDHDSNNTTTKLTTVAADGEKE